MNNWKKETGVQKPLKGERAMIDKAANKTGF